MRKKMKNKSYAVIGLGQFGMTVALTLAEANCDVLAIDDKDDNVQDIAEKVSYAVKADVRDPGILESLGVQNVDVAVIAVAENMEASITATMQVKELGVPFVMAKAMNSLHGRILEKIRNFDENMVGRAMKAVAIKNRQSLPKGGTLRLVNAIPPARGLGSSSAALVGGILIGNALTGNKMTREDMLTMATVLEGHPDNVAPAIYGGLSVSIMVDGKTLTNSIPIDDDLSFITVSPEVEVSTEEARKALPKTIDYQSAVFNVSRVSFLVSSLFTKQYDRIAYGLQDKLHVPYRLRLIPSGELVLKKAVEAGALGATISGSGSTLIAFATDQEVQIMDAMINCFNDHGIAATGHILKCSNEGAKLVE